MEETNEDLQEDVVVGEEQTSEEEVLETTEESAEESEESEITLSKEEFTKLKRKAIAYDAGKQSKKTETKTDLQDKKTESVSPERFERLELMADGYSKDEVDEIMSLGGAKVLDSKLVQSAIKAMRAEKKSKDASTALSPKSPVYKKHTSDDLRNMSSKELENILPRE